MPYWRISIDKYYLGQEWTNTWYVSAGTLAGAQEYGETLVTYERNIHLTPILFTNMHISTKVADGRNPFNVPVNQFGLRSTSAQQLLPKFLTFNLLLTLPSLGDPGRKYYHCGLRRNDVAGDFFETDFINEMGETASEYLDALIEGNVIITGGEKLVGDFSPITTVGMHDFKTSWYNRDDT